MAEFDLVIRGGTVVDGNGGAPRVAAVAVRDGVIVEVGEVSGRGMSEIDAAGLVVGPGFVDIHTHYDGQAVWDDRIQPSSFHGVTTVVAGNCGVGFAPVKPEHRGKLIALMEGVEDIPGTALHAGLSWSWTTFGEYLDTLETRAWDIDLATQVPHAALRFWAMGDRAAALEAATEQEIAEMAELAAQAVRDGALGFSTSRSINHKSRSGDLTPTYGTEEQELTGIAAAVGATGTGVLQLITDYPDYEPDASATVAARAEREGRTPEEVAYDILVKDEGRGMLHSPFTNYFDGNLDAVREMLTHPHTLPGLGDGGAHVGAICDSSFTSTLLQHWVRDRAEGRLPVEFVFQKQSRDTARAVGLNDRGVLEPGYRADIIVVDLENLRMRRPEVIYDLPGGERRMQQRVDGYRHVFVTGVETYTDGTPTGELPGRLIRGARPAPEGAPVPAPAPKLAPAAAPNLAPAR